MMCNIEWGHGMTTALGALNRMGISFDPERRKGKTENR